MILDLHRKLILFLDLFTSKEEGFYNFILKIIKIFILPDWLTEFIQVRLNICLDISVLETFREVLFIGLMVYSQMLVLQLQSHGLFILIHLQFPGVILLLPLIGQKMSFKEFCLLYLGKCYRNDFLGIIGVIG
jgi:hypothetical protein